MSRVNSRPTRGLKPDQRWNIARLIVPLACLVLIGLRMWKPSVNFDQTSLWLFMIAAVVLIIPDLGNILSRVKKIRRGDTEIEFESLVDNLKKRTEEAEEKAVAEGEEEERRFPGLPMEVQDRINRNLVNPRAALITLAVEIENILQNLAAKYDIPQHGRHFSPRRMIEVLVERNIVDPNAFTLFKDFWAIRNTAVHQHEFILNEGQLYELVDLGVRILRLLYGGSRS